MLKDLGCHWEAYISTRTSLRLLKLSLHSIFADIRVVVDPMIRFLFCLLSVLFGQQAFSQYQVILHLQQIQSATGNIKIAIFNQAVGFPTDQTKAYKLITIPAQKGQVKFSLGKLPPGKYAIAVFHDENADGQLNTNIIGIPTEGYAFSKKSDLGFGPPAFADAAIDIANKKEIEIQLSY